MRGLWALDLAFADVIATSSDQRLAAIRLAWWRERLEALDAGDSPPAEPRLQVIARELLKRGITGEHLSRLEDAWLPALEPFPWGVEQAAGFRLRGRILFTSAAELLGADPISAEHPGELWSLVDAALHCSDVSSRELLLSEARLVPRPIVPRKIRVLTTPLAVALAELNSPKAGLARGIVAVAHRVTGRLGDVPQ